MSAIILEWIRKAKADLDTAERELKVQESANFDAVCFHCQQSVEKLLKALMIHSGIRPPKTHDLELLLEKLSEKHPEVRQFRDACIEMTVFAVEYRYPGEESDENTAASALESAKELWNYIEPLLQQ
jgi:HEPN domain-containing protein